MTDLPEIKARLDMLREILMRHTAAYDAIRVSPTDLAWLIRELEAARERERLARREGFAEARDAAARLAETPSGPLLPLYIRIRQLQPKETE